MGAVSIDLERKSRTIEEKYVLYQSKGVKKVIKEYFNIKERVETKGDYDGVVLLADLKTAIQKANLGNRQSQVIELNKYGYTHPEIAKKLGIDHKTAEAYFTQATAKIANIYREWNYLQEVIQ